MTSSIDLIHSTSNDLARRLKLDLKASGLCFERPLVVVILVLPIRM